LLKTDSNRLNIFKRKIIRKIHTAVNDGGYRATIK
jgi:hypothetical protein